MGWDILMFVEKRRPSGAWDIVDPPSYRRRIGGGRYLEREPYVAGFLGCGARSPDRPLTPNHGSPPDLSTELRGKPEEIRYWIPLSEVLKGDLDQPVRRSGWVDAEGFREFSRTGQPPVTGCLPSWGPARKVGHAEMTRIVADPGLRQSPTLTDIEWQEPFRAVCPDFIDFLDRLKSEGPHADIRLLYRVEA